MMTINRINVQEGVKSCYLSVIPKCTVSEDWVLLYEYGSELNEGDIKALISVLQRCLK
jgi:hypothetical protein